MNFAMLAALTASLASPVIVAPNDPTAQFKSSAGSLKMDPGCRDYNLDTVYSNPDCARRVEALEPAPALAIAAHTTTEVPARREEALALLERAAAANEEPALYYLAGMLLGTGQGVRPDYPKAVTYLSIAADRGNPAAADLLASLLIEGKGAPRDTARAIGLYEMAAAGGFPSAGVSLGKLYLSGRHVPKDEALGRQWLEAAAAVNAPTAAQLAALAANDDKVHNYQLIPAPAPADVKVVRYRTFDNPDIPPNFGYDLAFQQVHDAPFDDAATLARLEAEAATSPTPYLYELARRLAPREPERALRTYLLARMRMRYDSSRCADPAAMESTRAWDIVVMKDIQSVLTSAKVTPAMIDTLLAEEAKLPGDQQPWWVCRSGMPAMTAAMEGNPGPLKLKPASEWPKLREDIRESMKGLAAAR